MTDLTATRFRPILTWLLLAAGACSAERLPEPFRERSLPVAPAIGEKMPDFEVTDVNGKRVSFHALRRGRKAYLLVVRSASW